jgi:predicted ATPase
VSLLAAPLSVPYAERYAPLALTPQQQKQQILDTMVAWLAAEAERQPVLVLWEDLHWTDPTTLERIFPAHCGERRIISAGYWNSCTIM